MAGLQVQIDRRGGTGILRLFVREHAVTQGGQRAATLLVATDAMIPNPIVNTPAMHAIFGARIIDQLRLTLRSRSRAISRNSHVSSGQGLSHYGG